MATRTLVLVRHGQYDLNSQARLEGPLTERGRQQAQLTREALRDLPMTAIHASTLTRAAQTADILAAAFSLEIQRTRELWELVPALPMRLLRQWYPDTSETTLRLRLENEAFSHLVKVQMANEFGMTPDTLETELEHAQANLQTLFARHLQPAVEADELELIVCHGNVIRAFVCRVLGTPLDMFDLLRCYHCGLTRIEVDAHGDSCLWSFNDTGHLPPDLRTEF